MLNVWVDTLLRVVLVFWNSFVLDWVNWVMGTLNNSDYINDSLEYVVKLDEIDHLLLFYSY